MLIYLQFHDITNDDKFREFRFITSDVLTVEQIAQRFISQIPHTDFEEVKN